MAYWLLLGLVYCLGFSLLLFQSAKKTLNPAITLAGVGFLFITVGLGAELALGFEFNQHSLRLFYLLRLMLPLAWIGHSLLATAWLRMEQVRWLNYGLLLASLVGSILVWRTGITAAQAWFDPGQPVHGQYAETLATNRPTRALLLLMNAYGALALAAVLALRLSRRSTAKHEWLFGGLLLLGAAGWLKPILLPPAEFSAWFYLLEWVPAVLLFAGLLYFLRTEAAAPPAALRGDTP
jgi:hypothetical protein